MPVVSIPPWTFEGILPPNDPIAPTSIHRSPYEVTLTDLVLRYPTSPQRIAILQGLLRFRASLHALGLAEGFQWLDGSFLEDVETLNGRGPRDMDVVTFFSLSDSQTQDGLFDLSPRLFDPAYTKSDYRIDGYFVQLNGTDPKTIVASSAYWYSMWSHTRDGQWKGFLQIGLSPADDASAQAGLNERMREGGQS